MTNRIFIKNPHGAEHISDLAAQVGLIFGETEATRRQEGRPGFVGNTFPVKDQLNAAGARWDGECKAWTFDTWADAEAAIRNIIEG